jgi:exodeoxyribonuclease VII large subunit
LENPELDFEHNGNQVFTVSEINKQVKSVIEGIFEKISVVGEISNFKPHVSGHWYFSLKDSDSVINCTMWRGFNNYVFFTPQDGMKVIVTGKLTVYPPRGSYQIDVKSMKPLGVGELQAAYEKLKQKLFAEGLFDEVYKKRIPAFPEKIGLVTSIDGAAFQDMTSVAKRRFPIVELVIAPCKVQGPGAAESIAQSLKELNKRNDIDVIIVARGGGSLEDLWAFNEEIVAREIFASKHPVICGIGHEIDFTIADFVADLRAPTPSVAMELAIPDQNELLSMINELSDSVIKKVNGIIDSHYIFLQNINNSIGFRSPFDKIKLDSQKIDNLLTKIDNSVNGLLFQKEKRLFYLQNLIDSFDMKKILKRGFVLVKQDSKYISRKNLYDISKPSELEFYDGKLKIGE